MQRRTLLKLAALSTIGVPYTKATASPSLSLLPSVHNKESITMNDVIIIGGSFAGLAAALQLGRARRKVIVLDTGLQRNRFAGRSHGMLGHDDKPPSAILAEARQQLARYPAIRIVNARADSISGTIDNFSVLTGDGETLSARRLILSYGVVDQMPDVSGFAENWGTSVIPCPYCDGFEVADQHWGLVWSGPQSMNQVRLFHDWTDRLTVFGNGHDITPDIRADLESRRYLSLMVGSTKSHVTGAMAPLSSSIPVLMSKSTSCSRIRATSHPQACMTHWASPRSTRQPASPSRPTSAAKPACQAFTPPVTLLTPASPRSPRQHGKERWQVSSLSSLCWFEKTS